MNLPLPLGTQTVRSRCYPIAFVDDNDDSRVVVAEADEFDPEDPKVMILEASIVRETPRPDDPTRTFLRPVRRAWIELVARGYVVAGVERGKSSRGMPGAVEDWQAQQEEDPDAAWAPRPGDQLRLQVMDLADIPTIATVVAEAAEALGKRTDGRLERKLEEILRRLER